MTDLTAESRSATFAEAEELVARRKRELAHKGERKPAADVKDSSERRSP